MSAENSIARTGRELDAPSEPTGFQMPPELAARYEVRVVDAANGEQRIGLFRPTDRENPSIEITNERVIARSEDPETVAALVKIAQHSGWDRVAVDGSPEFRQAVWKAATREGLTVSGYEPGFNEQARVERERREAATRRETGIREQAPPIGGPDGGGEAAVARSAVHSPDRRDQGTALGNSGPGLSDDDNRLLLQVSALTDDRYRLAETLEMDMPRIAREVQEERIGQNQEALTSALDRALASPTMVQAFERAGYEADALRRSGQQSRWDGEIADAIYLVRTGLHREAMSREASLTIADEIATDREERASPQHAGSERATPNVSDPARDDPERQAASDRRRENEELAELFLHGTSDRVAADPRLAQARQAQAAMEQHIGEVFNGDEGRMATANLESRQMISDALRRGLDVSVREPTPVRQIEPVHARPDMER